MKKSLFILPVLLLSSTVQIEAMKYNNTQSSVLDNLPESVKTEDILMNITNMDEDTLNWLSMVLDNLPESVKTEEVLFNLSNMDKNTLQNLNNNL